MIQLAVGCQLGESALPASRQRDQPYMMRAQQLEGDVRGQLQRPIEMRGRHEFRQIAVAGLVLGQQNQAIDAALPPDRRRARHAERRADDRLHPLGEAGVAERHDAVEPVAVGDRDRRKAELRGALGDRLGLHRPFEHREGREDAQRNEWETHDRDYASRSHRF